MSENKPSNLTNLKDVLDTHGEALSASINCVSIGTIVVFDPVRQVAQVSINYRKYVGGNWVKYPVLVDAPVVILTGGIAALTMPILPGDTCVLLFCDRPISEWFATGLPLPLPSFRMHSFADGMALIGIRNKRNAVKVYDMLHAKLSMGVAEVGVSATQVRVANAVTTLGSQLGTMCDQLTQICLTLDAILVTLGAPPTPNPMLATETAVGLIKTQLAVLLE